MASHAATARLEPEGLTAEEFTHVFRYHPAGVAIVTADAGAGPVGLTATSVFSVSADPPLLVFSLSSSSSSAPAIRSADTSVGTWLRGRVVSRMEAGSSTVMAIHALEAHTAPDVDWPLVYHNRSWHGLGDHSRLG